MADQWVLLRPNALHSRSSANVNKWPAPVGPPAGIECANDSDADYILAPVLDTNEYVVYHMSDFAFPAGSRITLLYPICRTNSAGGNPITPGNAQPLPYTFLAHLQCAGENSYGPTTNIYQQGWLNTSLPTMATKASGQPFTPDEVNNTLYAIWWDLTDNRAGTNGYKYAILTEFYIYVYYNVRPTTVVTAPAEGGSVTTTSSPTVTFTYTDPEADAKTAHRVKIFTATQYNAVGFDPETSAAVVDSGEVAGTGLSYSYATMLENNITHRAYVKTKDHLQWSLWDYNQFTINVTPPGTPGSTQPGAPSLIVTEEAVLARVKLELNEGTSPTVDWFTIERSEDGGITWTKVRDANPIYYPNLMSQNQSEMELPGTGWTANAQVAGFPSRDVGQIYAGAYALNIKPAGAGDNDTYSPWIPCTPGLTYRFRWWARTAVTPRTIRPYVRWSADAVEWTLSSGPGVDVVEVADGWREVVIEATCPAAKYYMGIIHRIMAAGANELHYLDTASIKRKILPITLYDNEVPRRLPAGLLKYRAQGVRYSAPQEQPMVTTTSTPYTANIAGALATDNRNWLKSSSDPTFNIPVRFAWESGEKWELTADEQQSSYAPKGRGEAVVFGTNTEIEEFDIPFAFLNDAEYEAFEALRKRREKLLLQTRYGDIAKPATQLWVQIKNRSTRVLNTTVQDGVTSRRVNVHFTKVGPPPGTILSVPSGGALDGPWLLLNIGTNAPVAGDPPMISKDSRGIVHYRGKMTCSGDGVIVPAGAIPVGYRVNSGHFFNWWPGGDGRALNINYNLMDGIYQGVPSAGYVLDMSSIHYQATA